MNDLRWKEVLKIIDGIIEATLLVLPDHSVNNTKLANMSYQTVKGRKTAGTGTAEDLTKSDLQSILDISGTNTGDETAARIGSLINGSANKAIPADADQIAIADSASSNILSKLTWANLKATLKSYFDSLYPSGSGSSSGTNTGDETPTRIGSLIHTSATKSNPVDADELGYADSAASYVQKKFQISDLKSFLKSYFDSIYISASSSVERLPTISNNGSDASNDIDLSTSRVIDKTFSKMIICNAETKQSDAAWAVGSGAGWLDEGTVGNNTYHIYSILRSDTGVTGYILSLCNDNSGTCTMTSATPCVVTFADHGFQTGQGVVITTTGSLYTGITAGTRYYVGNVSGDTFNLYDTQSHAVSGGATGRVNTSGSQSGVHTITSAPVLPSNYDYISNRLCSIIRSSGSILAFKNTGRIFDLLVPVNNVSTTFPGTSAVLVSVTAPYGVRSKARVSQVAEGGSTDSIILNTSPYQTDTPPSTSLFSIRANLSSAGGNVLSASEYNKITNRYGQVRTRSTVSGTLERITSHGWEEVV